MCLSILLVLMTLNSIDIIGIVKGMMNSSSRLLMKWKVSGNAVA